MIIHSEYWGKSLAWISVGEWWWWWWKQLQCRQWTLAWWCRGLLWQWIYGGRGDWLWRLRQNHEVCHVSNFEWFTVDSICWSQHTWNNIYSFLQWLESKFHQILSFASCIRFEWNLSNWNDVYTDATIAVYCWIVHENKDDAMLLPAAAPYHHYRRLHSCLKSHIFQSSANIQP